MSILHAIQYVIGFGGCLTWLGLAAYGPQKRRTK